MQIVFGHYPMTLAQLSAWARQQSALTPTQCRRALQRLDMSTITIRKV